MKKNKITRISLAGGLIGLLSTNPRKALEDAIVNLNDMGWSAIHIEPHKTSNMAIAVAQVVVLICTLGLWTWGGGYLVLSEMELKE